MKKLLLLPYTRTGGVIALVLLFSALILAAAVSFKDPTAGQLVGFHDPNTFTNMTVSGGSTQVVWTNEPDGKINLVTTNAGYVVFWPHVTNSTDLDTFAFKLGTANVITNRNQDFFEIVNGGDGIFEVYPDGSTFIGKHTDEGEYLGDQDVMLLTHNIISLGDRATAIWKLAVSDTNTVADYDFYGFSSFVVNAHKDNSYGQFYAEAFATNGQYRTTRVQAATGAAGAFTAKDANDLQDRIFMNPYSTNNFPSYIWDRQADAATNHPTGTHSLWNIGSGSGTTSFDRMKLLNNGTLINKSNHNVSGAANIGGILTLTNVAASSLLRTDASKGVSATTIGSGLAFDGTTLSATGGGGLPALTTITNGVPMGTTTNLEITAGTAITVSGTVVANTNKVTISGSTNLPALAVGSLTVTNQILVFPDDLKIGGIGAFNTNFIDAAAGALQVFTNSLSTNQVFIVTNGTVGLKVELFVYGAMFHGGIQTNAWQIVCAAPASPEGFKYFWPPGSTNGNYECLVNSNQVVKFFFEFPRSTNCMSSYRVYE